jgi:GNAT superfamily N-acetyltransferase
MIFHDPTRAAAPLTTDRPERVDIVRVATAFDYVQAALVLGEQRSFTEKVLGRALHEVQPSSQREFSHLASYYRPPYGKLLLARVNGEPVGVVGVRRLDGQRGEGKRLYVRPSARGRGIARRLVHELFAASRELGLRSLYIETSPTLLPDAYAMLVRLGFEETAKQGFPGVDDVIAMELQLDPGADRFLPPRTSTPTRRFARSGGLLKLA